jgi:PKD domain-containing protein
MKRNDKFVFTTVLGVTVLMLGIPSSVFRVSAQQKPPVQPLCPVTNVRCPSEVYAKDRLTFTADVSGGDPNVQPTYNWTVSAGTISSGQGTATIDVDTSGLEGTVTATVEAGGFDRSCGYRSTASSCTTSVMKKAEARKFDEYGKLLPKDENARLDNFMIELQSDPTTQAHIISYNTGRPGDAQKAADRAKNYLIGKRGLDRSRVVTVTGGSREDPTVELWIVPSGAPLPKPTPAVKPSEPKPTSPAKPAKP